MELFWLRAKNTQFADRHLNWDLHFNCTSWSSFARQQLLFLLFSLNKVLMHKSQPATDWHMYYAANSNKTNINIFFIFEMLMKIFIFHPANRSCMILFWFCFRFETIWLSQACFCLLLCITDCVPSFILNSCFYFLQVVFWPDMESGLLNTHSSQRSFKPLGQPREEIFSPTIPRD